MNPIDLAEQAGANPWLFMAAALLLGALHGLEPGHSKGIMAAFIIGTRGTYFQAIVLALCATLSHTAVVWILAGPASYGGAIWSTDEITPYMNLISGIVILFLAYWMLRRLNRAQGHGHHDGHDHHHDHGHDHGHGHHHHSQGDGHVHGHEHTHSHDHDDDHERAHAHVHEHTDEHGQSYAHSHAVPEKALATALEMEDDEHARHHIREIAENFSGREVSLGQVALFGLSSGLAPCTAAIVILITCFQLHQPWLGFALVAMFSLGLGLTLTAVAVLASWGTRTLGERSQAFQDIVRKAPFLSALVTAAVGIFLIVQFFRANF